MHGIKLRIKLFPQFYQLVWLECLKVKPGFTVSYGEIAKRIGRPMSSRAVGNALKHNPYPITIPCHRVIRKNGSIGGYSAKGGVRKKKIILKKEQLINGNKK